MEVQTLDLRRRRERGTADHFNDEESALLAVVAAYRQQNHVEYVTPTDVLWILRRMGYEKRPAVPA